MTDNRLYYRSANRIAWSRLPVLLFGSLLTAGVAAVLLEWLFEQGWYLIILVPFLVALAMGGSMVCLVALCHFRNRWWALAIGALTGLVSYLGYYYLSIVVMSGVWMNPVNLPAIIQFRMQNDVARKAGRVGDKAEKPVPFMNWFAFAMEAAACVGLPASTAFMRSRRAYCEELKQWYAQDTKQVPGGYGEAIIYAFGDKSLNELLATMPPADNPQASDTLTLEYIVPPSGGSPTDYPIYFSITGQGNSLKRLLSQTQLSPDEIVPLLPLFPKASRFLAERDRAIGQKVEELQQQRAAETLSRYSPSAAATVTPVPEPYRKLLQDKSYKWKVNLVGLIPVFLFFGGIGSIALGAWKMSGENAMLESAKLGPAVAMITLGIMALGIGVYAATKLLGVPETMWINWRFRKIIERRRGVPAWVLQPSSELVCLTPRDSFLTVGLTMTSDVLFMNVDQKDRTIHLIGDSDDYVIPVDAILEFGPVQFYHPTDQYQLTELWYTRLLVSFGNDVRELLLSQAHLSFWPSTNKTRRRKEESLCQRIALLKAGY